MSTKIADHFFKYGGMKYFRDNAHMVELGTFGEKKDPLGAKSKIDPHGKVKRDYIDHRTLSGGSVTINWSETKESTFGKKGEIQVFGVGARFSTGFGFARAKSARVKLYNFFINEGPLTKILNNDARAARNYLAAEGKDGRIVSEIWVAMEAELAEHFESTSEISVGVSAAGNDLEIKASGGRLGTQTVVISEGTTFAYKMHKVKKWNRGKTKIENMEADYHGMS